MRRKQPDGLVGIEVTQDHRCVAIPKESMLQLQRRRSCLYGYSTWHAVTGSVRQERCARRGVDNDARPSITARTGAEMVSNNARVDTGRAVFVRRMAGGMKWHSRKHRSWRRRHIIAVELEQWRAGLAPWNGTGASIESPCRHRCCILQCTKLAK